VLATAEGLAAPLVDTATRITGALVEPVLAPVLDAVGVVASGPAPPAPRTPGPTWTGPGRVHVPVHGVSAERLEGFAADLAAAVTALDGVDWAARDPGGGRLVVAGTEDTEPVPELIDAGLAAVEAVERDAGAMRPPPDLDPPRCSPKDRTVHSALSSPMRSWCAAWRPGSPAPPSMSRAG
jgi:cation-transporting P-type ATPase I